MANVINISDCSFSNKEKLLVDTNIFLYVYNPYNSGSDYRYADEFIYKIIYDESECELYITELIIAEYINRICRTAFESFKIKMLSYAEKIEDISKKNQEKDRIYKLNFKRDFRETDEFKKAYNLAIESIQTEILPITRLINVDSTDVENSISNPIMKDFNDLVHLNMAKRLNLNVVTHDKDFWKADKTLTVYSAL